MTAEASGPRPTLWGLVPAGARVGRATDVATAPRGPAMGAVGRGDCEDLGADDGNRTRVASLEDWGSTIELRPHRSRLRWSPDCGTQGNGCRRAHRAPRRPSRPAGVRRDVAQVGSASALGAEGRGFESRHPDRRPTHHDDVGAVVRVPAQRPARQRRAGLSVPAGRDGPVRAAGVVGRRARRPRVSSARRAGHPGHHRDRPAAPAEARHRGAGRRGRPRRGDHRAGGLPGERPGRVVRAVRPAAAAGGRHGDQRQQPVEPRWRRSRPVCPSWWADVPRTRPRSVRAGVLRVLDDPSFRRRAGELAREYAEHDGVARTVSVITEVAGSAR